jgi:hypothetical protein
MKKAGTRKTSAKPKSYQRQPKIIGPIANCGFAGSEGIPPDDLQKIMDSLHSKKKRKKSD